MGKGDKKSKKGKIFKGSYGVVRPRKKNAKIIISTKKKATPKKETKPKNPATKKKTSTKK